MSTIFGDLSSIDFLEILDGIKGLVPVVLPAVIGFLAFRKGWAFLRGAIRGA